ncbi:hypothetical protein POLEWNIK_00120 [Brevundimonas phage vB_BpoS-Polewnik]|nr:hypothetical protein POLEWNIK_00120 [Brevundimonas phage vB_BpoS-Polewnik]
MTIEINAERIAQIADINAAFDFAGVAVDSIIYDDDAETITVVSASTRYVFEIGSDDDALVFINTVDDRDYIRVAIPAE